MNRFALVLLSSALAAAFGAAACQSNTPPAAQSAASSATAGDTSAARGATLVLLGSCDDCHTPQLPNGEPDMSRRFSGYPAGTALPPAIPGVMTMQNLAWRGPWGLSLTRNITPDKVHGIGNWSAQDFINTMRTGKDPSGHVLLPPMPVANLGKLPDDMLTAIYNFIQTLPPSSNAVTGP